MSIGNAAPAYASTCTRGTRGCLTARAVTTVPAPTPSVSRTVARSHSSGASGHGTSAVTTPLAFALCNASTLISPSGRSTTRSTTVKPSNGNSNPSTSNRVRRATCPTGP
ncbi:hypothetical protein [Kribbella catacumbae]|uniref:hypothetical protein n=1 Tax=Kribbella catacumbae TaxID=460086 RepID=UPI001ED9BD52|nr:hypothetical protein [Kribbella catacumbae]